MHITGQKAVRGKPKYVDYLLVHKNVPQAVVEAKDNKHAIGAGMQQGKNYAAELDVPFVYSSNGDGFLDFDTLATSGTFEHEIGLDAFPSHDKLWQRYKTSQAIKPDQEKIITSDFFRERDGKTPRYYQEIAINRMMRAIARGQNRVLLVMATGTGKTYTVSQIIWRLRRARPGIRILFLADQAMTNDIKQFGDVMTKIRGRVIDKSYEVYLALYQGVSDPEDWQDAYRQFSADFFDLVIINECHRGSAAEGDFSDLIVEQGPLQQDDLQTETMVMPFHYAAGQALDSINGWKGGLDHKDKKRDYTTFRCAIPVDSGRVGTRTAS